DGESFAEIFSGNCTALGLPAVRVSHRDALALMARVEADPALGLVVDLDGSVLTAGAEKFPFTMPESDRRSLVTGEWDTTSVLLAHQAGIRAAAARIPYVSGFKG
ncbi:MAG TPA: isopropylmalate isomerase, partial [Spirochaetia bacterium]|nr:isopropylmalate isomerase [Spirochaetia bacterium]